MVDVRLLFGWTLSQCDEQSDFMLWFDLVVGHELTLLDSESLEL